jgi:membrane protein DedA with SNARE-associated domain
VAAVTAQEQAGPGPAPSADPWSDPRLPWEGRPRRVDIACWAAITLSGLYYLALLPFRASLIGTFAHSVILEVLNGSTEAIVSAAAYARTGHGSLAVVLLASIPGLMKFDLIYWWAGRLWGERVIHLFAGQSERRGLLAGLGYELGQHAVSVAQTISRYGLWVSIGIVVLVVAGQMRGARAQR